MLGADILHEYVVYLDAIKGLSDNTRKNYICDIELFFKWMRKNISGSSEPVDDMTPVASLEELQSITLSDLHNFLSWLNTGKHLSNKTRARKVSTLRSLFKYLSTVREYIASNPAEKLEQPRMEKKVPRFLTPEQATHLINSIDGPAQERDTAIIFIFLTMGLRLSELKGLNLSSLSKDSITVLGKGNKERIVYIPAETQLVLNNYLAIRYKLRPKAGHEDALFMSRLNRRISERAIEDVVNKAVMKSGLSSRMITTHKLRHSYATMALHNGVDLRTLQTALGHATVATTEIYTHVESTDLRLAARTNELKAPKHIKK